MESCLQASIAVGAHGFNRCFSPTSALIQIHHPTQLELRLNKPHSWEIKRSCRIVIANCSGNLTAPSPVSESEKKQFDESVITEEELSVIGEMRGKCNGMSGGIAELLECLETEAIMGDDDGKEPTDYNRRAMIFDKSSRVFQALKDSGCNTLSV